MLEIFDTILRLSGFAAIIYHFHDFDMWLTRKYFKGRLAKIESQRGLYDD